MKILLWFLPIICSITGFAQKQDQKPITVVICSYKNRNYYQKNLESVLNQEYGNYRIIYTDDCSPDGTADAVEEFAKGHPNGHRLKLIRNQKRRKAMANLWHAIHMCNDEEIVITLDGDDWLPHNKVLDIVASYYRDPDVWVAYSNHTRHPSGAPGISRAMNESVINRVGIRNHPYVASHLRSFYAGLFKEIKLQDLLYEGEFVPATYDLAMFFPMLEMAKGHIRFMRERLYVYNCTNPISDHRSQRKMQAIIDKYVRGLNPYQPLSFHPANKPQNIEENKVDLVVFSYNRPMQLYAFLESLYKWTTNFNQVHVIFRSDKEYETGYAIVKEAFPTITWKRQKRPPADFKTLTCQAAFDQTSQAKYIAFAVDDIIFKDQIDFIDTTRLMEKTKGYAFLLRLGKEINHNFMTRRADAIPHYMQIEPDAIAWQLSQVRLINCWGYANNVDMTIYRKADAQSYFFGQTKFTNPNILEAKWKACFDRNRIALCYNSSKIINIPMNIVTTFKNRNCHSYSIKELLEKFMAGFKLNIDAAVNLKHNAVHVNFDPGFVKRENEAA